MNLNNTVNIGILRVPLREYMKVISKYFMNVPTVLFAMYLSTEFTISLSDAGKLIQEYNSEVTDVN